MARIAALYRYPVKGLSATPLDRIGVAAGAPIPFDRVYAIENGPSRFDPARPQHLAKTRFLMLMSNERLASLATTFDQADQRLTIRQDGAVVAAGRLDTESGRRAIEAFVNRFAADDLRGPARVLRAAGHTFSDHRDKVVSLVNLESVRDIERRIGATVDPLRFRANLYVEGLPAWAEFDWVGNHIAAGGIVFDGVQRIGRCAAINVDPRTARRDLAIPQSLLRFYRHSDCGVYFTVVKGGQMSVGDRIGPV